MTLRIGEEVELELVELDDGTAAATVDPAI